MINETRAENKEYFENVNEKHKLFESSLRIAIETVEMQNSKKFIEFIQVYEAKLENLKKEFNENIIFPN